MLDAHRSKAAWIWSKTCRSSWGRCVRCAAVADARGDARRLTTLLEPLKRRTSRTPRRSGSRSATRTSRSASMNAATRRWASRRRRRPTAARSPSPSRASRRRARRGRGSSAKGLPSLPLPPDRDQGCNACSKGNVLCAAGPTGLGSLRERDWCAQPHAQMGERGKGWTSCLALVYAGVPSFAKESSS